MTNEVFCDIIIKCKGESPHAPVAQQAEHLTFNQGVRSSNLRRSTKKHLVLRCFFLLKGYFMMKLLCDFLDASMTPFHATAEMEAILKGQGFQALSEYEPFALSRGGKYYVTRNSSSLIAFVIPCENPSSFQMAAAHSDSPCFRIKGVEENSHYMRLRTETYGGTISSTWFDRPLSMAGRIYGYDENHNIKECLVNSSDVFVIPSVAIHLNKNVNTEKPLVNPACDLIALASDADSKDPIVKMFAENGIQKDSVLSKELFLYSKEKSFIWGERRYITAPRLDDLMCAYGLLAGVLEAVPQNAISVLCVFDNEEIGNCTKQGADSSFLSDTLFKIAESIGKTEAELKTMLAKSFMISADNAHAVHPNHPELSDADGGACYMNHGIVIKHSASASYATDAFSEAMLVALCEKYSIPYQHYNNRADMPGGRTLGNTSCSHVSIPTVDIGLAQLAMHSAVETAGMLDVAHLSELAKHYFSHALVVENGAWHWN